MMRPTTAPHTIVVNIALPHIQTGLHFSVTSSSWVLNGYTLTFGGLLLLGGRAGDILGRRRMFLAGIAIFTFASLAGGLAPNAGVLLAARAVQGVGGALASPAVLALIVSAYSEGRGDGRQLARPRSRRGDHAVARLALGAVHQHPDRDRRADRHATLRGRDARVPGRFDLAGAITSVAGVGALVYAFIRAASNGWGASG
jgi:hypothetical protein